jgi:hypothetical protein
MNGTEKNRNAYENMVDKPEKVRQLKGYRGNGRILKWILKKRLRKYELDLCGSRYGQLRESCESRKQHLGFIKCG